MSMLPFGWPPGEPPLSQTMSYCTERVLHPARVQPQASVLGSWANPRGTRLGINKGGKGAVRLPKIIVLASGLLHARRAAGIRMAQSLSHAHD